MRADARERRNRIIATACELYRSRNHDSLTLEEIAEEAQVGIATLYRNFPDRWALDMACAAFLFDKVIALQEFAIAEFSTAPRTVWHEFNLALFSKGLGTLVPALAPESLDELPPEISELRKTTEDNTRILISLGQEYGLIASGIDATTYIVGLITVSRPPVHAFKSIAHNFGTDLLGLFLSGLEHGIARPTSAVPTTVVNHERTK